MIGSVYYLKVMKICYVDNPTSWRSYGKVSPVTAYIIAISVSIMMIGLWWGNALFLFTHILALSVSTVGLNNFFLLFFLIKENRARAWGLALFVHLYVRSTRSPYIGECFCVWLGPSGLGGALAPSLKGRVHTAPGT